MGTKIADCEWFSFFSEIERSVFRPMTEIERIERIEGYKGRFGADTNEPRQKSGTNVPKKSAGVEKMKTR